MRRDPLAGAKVLILDDEPANVRLLERLLQRVVPQPIVRCITDPRTFVANFREFSPDLILLDLMMPYLDGFAILEQLASLIPANSYLPVLILTADTTTDSKRRALAAGAHDFLSKPFDGLEVLLRSQNLLRAHWLHLELEQDKAHLEERVRERTRDLEMAQFEILERLARAAEHRDDDTGQHTQRVGRTAAAVARELGLPAEDVALLRRAAPLHDVGKIGIPDSILLKPGRLSDDEMATMRTHTTIGARILAGGRSPVVRLAEEIALTHHERWDGAGYPVGLAGDAIPIAGRVVAIADVLDALTHSRPYKHAWSLSAALDEIRDQRGRQFDPQVVDALLACWQSGTLQTGDAEMSADFGESDFEPNMKEAHRGR